MMDFSFQWNISILPKQNERIIVQSINTNILMLNGQFVHGELR